MEIAEKPLVSVIIPTYNRKDYLELTIKSILNQTFENFEIIVVDDGSPNDDNDILCKTFSKVRYIKIDNFGGPARPRNVGIRESKGKYIAFVDDDDLWLPLKLEKQVKVLEENQNFGLVHNCCEVIDKNGKLKNEIVGRTKSPETKHGDVSLGMIGSWTIMMPTPLVRKEVIDKTGFFNEEMTPATEDVEYWSRCSFETEFYYIDEPLVQYRMHSNNLSGTKERFRRLPYYLKEVIVHQKNKKRISKSDYHKLLQKMCVNQINYIKDHYKLTISILFEIDKFWFLRFKNLKSLFYNLILKG